MAITIQQLARKLGVSPMTVSYALRDFERVAPETRKRVKTLARELGYRPNSSAVSMRMGQANAVGVVQSTTPICSRIAHGTLHGLQDEIAKHDLRLVMSQLPDMHLTDTEKMPRILREWSVDGVVMVYTHHQPPGLAAMLEDSLIPAVWLNSKFERNCIYPDDHGAYFNACSHLIKMGHRRIAYSSFRRLGHYSQSDRRDGYLAAMRAAGLTPVLHELQGLPDEVEGHVSQAGRVSTAIGMLNGADRPTAVLCYGGVDECYPWVIAAYQVGLRVPGDLALIGTTDRGLGDLGFEIGVLELPVFEMGREAVRLVMQRIERPGEDVPASIIPFGLRPGDTCGPPSGR